MRPTGHPRSVAALTLGRRGRERRVGQHVGPGGRRVRHGQPHGAVASRATGQLLAEPSPAVAEPHLDPRLRQLGTLGQLLPRVDVRVLRPFERLLQFVQLLRRERRPTPALLPLQGNPRLGLAVRTLARLAYMQQHRETGSLSPGKQ